MWSDTILTASSRLGPTIVDRSFVFQPVHVADVAERIAALLGAGSSEDVVEFAGPEVLGMAELARQWQEERGRIRPIWSVRVPGNAARAVRSRALTTASQPVGSQTWHDFLADRY